MNIDMNKYKKVDEEKEKQIAEAKKMRTANSQQALANNLVVSSAPTNGNANDRLQQQAVQQ